MGKPVLRWVPTTIPTPSWPGSWRPATATPGRAPAGPRPTPPARTARSRPRAPGCAAGAPAPRRSCRPPARARPGAAASATDAPAVSPPRLERADELVDDVVDVALGRPHAQLRAARALVGRPDAGEAGQVAGAGPGVEALGVAALALLDRRVDVDLEERQARGAVQAPRAGAIGRHGGDERDDRHDARVGEQPREVGDAPDVLGAVGLGEAQVARQAVAQVVAVEEVGGPPVVDEPPLERDRDRRLARGREAGQPDRGAPLPERRPPLVAGQGRRVPGDVAHAARRSAR